MAPVGLKLQIIKERYNAELSRQVTPQKRKGSMGPPATPSSSSPSKALVLGRSSTPVTPVSRRLLPSPSSSPSPSPSSSYRLDTPIAVKNEPIEIPPRSPSFKRELTPCPSPSTPPPLRLRQRLGMLSRASASPSPSVRRGSRASSVSSELSMSSIGSRRRSPFRIGTQEFDPRPKQRTNRVREGDTPAATANTAPVKPFPTNLEKAISELTTVFGGWLPAEEAVGKVDLQKRCWDVVSNKLLREGMADVAKAIAGELKDLEKAPHASAVEDFVAELRRSTGMIVLAAIGEYPVEGGSKTKTLAARRLVWYSQYQDSLPLARAQATACIPSSIASKLLSFLFEEWLKRLESLAADIKPHVEAVSRLDCRAVVEAVRRVAEVVVDDIWGTK